MLRSTVLGFKLLLARFGSLVLPGLAERPAASNMLHARIKLWAAAEVPPGVSAQGPLAADGLVQRLRAARAVLPPTLRAKPCAFFPAPRGSDPAWRNGMKLVGFTHASGKTPWARSMAT
eukprot:15080199-Alexandrium_andersonii.AAC.1